MIQKRILVNILEQIAGWRSNLDFPQPKRPRNDCNDIATIQSLQFWLRSYYNGLVLNGWASKRGGGKSISEHEIRLIKYPNYHRAETFYVIHCGQEQIEIIQKPTYCPECGVKLETMEHASMRRWRQ